MPNQPEENLFAKFRDRLTAAEYDEFLNEYSSALSWVDDALADRALHGDHEATQKLVAAASQARSVIRAWQTSYAIRNDPAWVQMATEADSRWAKAPEETVPSDAVLAELRQ